MIEHTEQAAVETSVIRMTTAAADKVRELLVQENDPSLGLRIFVAGGGCSGSVCYGGGQDSGEQRRLHA